MEYNKEMEKAEIERDVFIDFGELLSSKLSAEASVTLNADDIPA